MRCRILKSPPKYSCSEQVPKFRNKLLSYSKVTVSDFMKIAIRKWGLFPVANTIRFDVFVKFVGLHFPIENLQKSLINLEPDYGKLWNFWHLVRTTITTFGWGPGVRDAKILNISKVGDSLSKVYLERPSSSTLFLPVRSIFLRQVVPFIQFLGLQIGLWRVGLFNELTGSYTAYVSRKWHN